MPTSVYQQEYFCSFREAEDATFSFEDIRAALVPDVVPLFPIGG
jgi:hypothetical protein